MRTYFLRPRFLGALRVGALSCGVFAACGGRLNVDGPDGSVDRDPTGSSTSGGFGGRAGSGTTGSAATTGMAMSTSTSGSGGRSGAAGAPVSGGTAGAGGSGRVEDAGVPGKRAYICFSTSQLRMMCLSGKYVCFFREGAWDIDAAYTCPDRLVETSTCAAYDDAGGCCYLAPLPNSVCPTGF